MKILLTTIAALLVVGCGPSMDIWEAAYYGNIEAVKQHLADGVDVNAKDEVGKTPLDRAVFFNHTEIIDLLRKHGGKTSNWLNADDSIHSAAGAGHIEAVKQHLAAGTDVNAQNDLARTPLYNAAEEGHKEIAELLIAKGADVNTKVEGGVFSGRTPLDLARLTRQTETIDLLRKRGAKTGKELEAEGK